MGQKLPDASALGPREALQTRGVVRMEGGREAAAQRETAQALTNAGRVVGEIGMRIQDRADRLNYVKEKSIFLQSMVSAETEIGAEGDTDFKTFGPRLNEKLQKAKQQALTKIQNPDMRAQFEADADLDIMQGISRMGSRAWDLERKNGVAEMNATIARNRELYLTAKDDATRESLLDNTRQTIEINKQNRYIDPEEAEEMGRKSAQDFVVGRISVLPPDQQIAVLNQNGGIGDLVPEDMKVALLEKAETESITNLRNQEWLAQQEQEKLYNELDFSMRQNNGSLAGVTPEQLFSLTESQRKNLLSESRDIAEGKYTATNWDKYTELLNLASNPKTKAKFTKLALSDYYKHLGPTERKKIIELQASMLEGKKEAEGFLTRNERLIAKTKDIFAKDSEAMASFSNQLDEWHIAYENNNGKKPSVQEIDDQIDYLIAYETPGADKDWKPFNEGRVFQLPADKQNQRQLEDLRADFKTRKNREPTDDEMLMLYNIAVQQGLIREQI